ncbi:Retrovirus-related Pol polyprotein from transposon TNT 1-94 [Nymphaea thermarum]|nr:Retrovirus-related Pol polyprotein from transposon TNT 1-94 [Nymphaea thermarum]
MDHHNRNSFILSSSFLSQLISQKLNHTNYLTWKRQIVPFIKSHRLYGHLNGTTPAPPEWIMREVKNAAGQIQETVAEINPEYETWMAHDQSLVTYITSTLSEEVLAGVDDDLSALELWNVLATTYSQVSEARFLQLKRQIQDIKRGTRSVLEYIHEIKNVSDQLAIIGHPVSDKDKVQQTLSGLGSDFDVFCTGLEALPVLPSFEDLKAKLIQHEASRIQRQELFPSGSHNVLVTETHALQGSRPRVWNSQAGMGRGILPTPNTNAQANVPRRIPTCFYCNKRGHVKSECWHNPQNKGKQVRRDNKAVGSVVSNTIAASNIPTDVQQILMTALFKVNIKQNEGQWYVDSGAATHVTGDAALAHVSYLKLHSLDHCRQESADFQEKLRNPSGNQQRRNHICFLSSLTFLPEFGPGSLEAAGQLPKHLSANPQSSFPSDTQMSCMYPSPYHSLEKPEKR